MTNGRSFLIRLWLVVAPIWQWKLHKSPQFCKPNLLPELNIFFFQSLWLNAQFFASSVAFTAAYFLQPWLDFMGQLIVLAFRHNRRLLYCKLLCGFFAFYFRCLQAETTQEAIRTFERHTQSNWLHQIDQQTEAITRKPESVTNQIPNLMMEKPSDHHHRQKLESYYQNEDFDGLQSFGEQRAQQLETEQSPEGEAWRLLNQSPGRYYPDANEHKILKPVELGINALQHPNTWSKQKHWPTDSHGNPVYDSSLDGKSEMNATIARLRQHFKGCDYQKKLVLKKDRQVHRAKASSGL